MMILLEHIAIYPNYKFDWRKTHMLAELPFCKHSLSLSQNISSALCPTASHSLTSLQFRIAPRTLVRTSFDYVSISRHFLFQYSVLFLLLCRRVVRRKSMYVNFIVIYEFGFNAFKRWQLPSIGVIRVLFSGFRVLNPNFITVFG